MSVDFPPAEDSGRAQQVVDRVMELIREQHDTNQADKIEINLIQFIPQELAKTRKFTFGKDDLLRPPATSEIKE